MSARDSPTTSASPLAIPSTAAASELAREAAEVRSALAKVAHHVYFDNTSSSLFLSDLDALHFSLHQHILVILLVGKESPRLGAVEEILKQSSYCAAKHASVLERPQVDAQSGRSGRAEGSHLSALGHELTRLRSRVTQVTGLLRNLIFCTIIRAGFADTSRTSISVATHSRSEVSIQEIELADVLEQLARIWNWRRGVYASHARGAQESTLQRTAALEVNKDRTLARLLRLVGLKTHPLTAVSLDDLDQRSYMDYHSAVVGVGSLAIRQQYTFSPPIQNGFQDCQATIHIVDHQVVEAAKFQVTNGRFTWFDQNGVPVLEHELRRESNDRFPWKHAAIVDLLGQLCVSFTEYQARASDVRCFGQHGETHLHEAPDYVFHNKHSYEAFQSAMRERHFVEEHEIKKITPKGPMKMEPSERMYIKVWRARSSDGGDLSLTIPVTSSGQEVRHQELLLKWMICKIVSAKELKLELKRTRRSSMNKQGSERPREATATSRRPSSKSFGIFRALTGQGKLNAPVADPIAIDEDESAPKMWTDRFHEFRLVFVDQTARDAFMRLYDNPQSAIRDASNASFTLGSPAISGRSPATASYQTGASSSLQISTSPPPSDYTTNTSISGVVLSVSPTDTAPPPLEKMALPPPDTSQPIEKVSGPKLETSPKVAKPFKPSDLLVPTVQLRDKRSFYRPLNGQLEIRLLRLERGEGMNWECSLEHYTFGHAPKYEALSYCWGTDQTKVGVPGGDLKGFPISPHLWRALRRLRHGDKKRARYLWIDAVCIDQDNVDEKNHQIKLLPQIYAHSLATVIWIGDRSPEIGTCLRSYPKDNSTERIPAFTLCTSATDLSAFEHENVFEDLRGELQYLQEMERHSGNGELWWKRLWCVQEFHQSRHTPSVLIGRHSIPWDHFRNMFAPDDDSLALFGQLGLWSKEGMRTTRSLFSLLSMTGSFHCTDPRDRVFSLLGMADQDHVSIVPDYGSSVLKVLEEACLALVQEQGTLDVLLDKRVSRSMRTKVEESSNFEMPTWMPDLTCLQSLQYTSSNQYNAGPGPPDYELIKSSTLSDSDHGDLDSASTLKVKAVFFDKIKTRISKEDLLEHEHSPDNHLIYNSLRRRGELIDRILERLDYSFKDHAQHSQHKHLDPSPSLGWLMLDYLFAGQRSIIQELRRRDQVTVKRTINSYKRQKEKDLKYVEEDEASPRDAAYVRDRWDYKISRAEEGQVFIPERMQDALNCDNTATRSAIARDWQVARDLENIFSYARRSKTWYYLTKTPSPTSEEPNRTDVNLDAPMRREVLESQSVDEVKDLDNQYDTQALDLEFYAYDAKVRERDLFKTSAGFLGLGTSALREGDEIIVPKGSSRPWIVRPVEGLGRNYTFVGEAVVPNIMSERYANHEAASALDYRIK